MQKNVEIELKLLLGKRELKKLLASELLKGVLRAGSEKKRNLVSSYYDTADLAFKKNGVAYRVRDKGDGSFEATAGNTAEPNYAVIKGTRGDTTTVNSTDITRIPDTAKFYKRAVFAWPY